MTKNVEQKFNEVKAEFETTEQAIGRLVEKRGQLQDQLSRLNLIQQFQKQGLIRQTPTWIINEHNELVVNSSSG